MLHVRVVLRCVLLAITAIGTTAAERDLTPYHRADIAAAKTSIYVGSVTLTLPPFLRVAGGYEADYAAKVFPFFFSNEAGRLRIELADATLRQLEAGQAIEFTGTAIRSDGLQRRVHGKATPTDAQSGRIKVRVNVTRTTELIFNTTYRFPGVTPSVIDH